MGMALLECSFELKNKPMSAFTIGALSAPAFSGLGSDVNRRMAMCNKSTGPISVGNYYIFGRESGGLFGPLWDILNQDKANGFRCMPSMAKLMIT